MRINIAPTSSTKGHYVEVSSKEAVQCLDAASETYLILEDTVMVAENHEPVPVKAGTIVTCQKVTNPWNGLRELSQD
jgi:hypothetical protein